MFSPNHAAGNSLIRFRLMLFQKYKFSSLLVFILICSAQGFSQGQNNFQDGINEFNKNNFKGDIAYFNKLIHDNPLDSNSYYYRGLCFLKANDSLHACLDFNFASQLGMFSALQASYTNCDGALRVDSMEFKGLIKPALENNYDSEPMYPGGLDSLRYLVATQIKVDPDFRLKIRQSELNAILNIEQDGSISEVYFLEKDYSYQNKISALLKQKAKWIPVYRNKKPIACSYLIRLVDQKFNQRVANRTYNAGIQKMQEGDTNEELNLFSKTIVLNPNDLEAYYNRGICHFKTTDTVSACTDWSFAVLGGYKAAAKIVVRVCDSIAIYKSDTLDFTKSTLDREEAFTKVEVMPQFLGGESKLFQFIRTNLKYPKTARESGIQGMVYISFVVNKMGFIERVKIVRGIGAGCNEAALEMMDKMPQWTPGYQDGKAVNVQMILPVSFNLR